MNLRKGDPVHVTERPQLKGVVVELVSPNYVKVKFDGIEEEVGCATERLTLG